VDAEKKVDSINQNINPQICFNNKEKEKILNKILATNDLQTYLTPLHTRSLPVEILTNEFITSDLEIRTNGQTVILRDTINKSDRTFKFSFPKINCEKQILEFTIWYEFEHADIVGKAINLNNEWVIEITGHGIVD